MRFIETYNSVILKVNYIAYKLICL